MSDKNKKLLIDAIEKDFVKKNKSLSIGCIAAAVLIVIVSVLIKTYYFAVFALPFIAIAYYTYKNSKKYSDPKNIEKLTFSEEICTVKANELSTTGNIRYLVFSNKLRYDISFTEASLYNEAREGAHFLMASDPEKNVILKLLPLPESEYEVSLQSNKYAAPDFSMASKDDLPGLTVSLKNMMDQNNTPIIVCNLLHQVYYLNKAGKNQFSAENKSFPDGTTLLDLTTPENMIAVQKALVWFSEAAENNKTNGWKKTDDRKIDIYALRDNDSNLSGYYLQ